VEYAIRLAGGSVDVHATLAFHHAKPDGRDRVEDGFFGLALR